jgi:hypothetical protein
MSGLPSTIGCMDSSKMSMCALSRPARRLVSESNCVIRVSWIRVNTCLSVSSPLPRSLSRDLYSLCQRVSFPGHIHKMSGCGVVNIKMSLASFSCLRTGLSMIHRPKERI